jgi:diacylglycerol kinase (ATP)
MGSHFGPLRLIVNPRAGTGVVRRTVPELTDALEARGIDYHIVETVTPGHATRAAREALDEGIRFLVAVGGDGTVHEVVNGMMEGDRALAPDPVLGVVAAGSGCDFIRTFGLPPDSTRAVKHLGGENLYPIDVGKVTFTGRDGREETRYFANIAEVGLGGAVVHRANDLPRLFGGSRYFFGFWLTLPRHKVGRVRVDVDRRSYDGRGVWVVVGISLLWGGGRRTPPRSYPGDGALDVLVFKGPKSESFTTLPKVYKGEHVPHPNVVELKGRTIRVEGDRPLPVEADGETLGTTPASFEVLPQIINLKI